jgi:hypothetical protein
MWGVTDLWFCEYMLECVVVHAVTAPPVPSPDAANDGKYKSPVWDVIRPPGGSAFEHGILATTNLKLVIATHRESPRCSGKDGNHEQGISAP